ncbi:MAG: sensor domain-containing diguanylate cyclase, partial [bacterium]
FNHPPPPRKRSKIISMIKNINIYFAGVVLFIIIVVLIGGVLFFTGPITIRNISSFNSNLLLKTIKLNNDIRSIKSSLDKVIYYSVLKPSPIQKERFKKALHKLKLSLQKTDKQYKELNIFIKKNSAFVKNNRRIIVYFNKSYFKWRNISKPILAAIIKYPEYISTKISYKIFLRDTLYLSHLPVINIVKKTNIYFLNGIKVATYMFIIATVVIIIMLILFFYYFNKFNEILLKSEQRFRSLFYNLPLASFIVDIKTGKFIDVNDEAIKFYGYSKNEFLNMGVESINVSNTIQELADFRKLAAEKRSAAVTFKHKLKNGTIKIVEVYVVAALLNNKTYLQGIVLDITERILLEDKLKESEELFRIMTENLITGITLYREKYVYVNPTAENILGYTRDEVYQKYVWDLFPDEFDKKTIKKAIEKRLNGEMFQSATYTIKVLTKQNKEIWLLISSTTVKYKDKLTALASFIDITEMINLRNELEREKEFFKILIENIGVPISLNKEKIIYVNSETENLTGYSKEELYNMNIWDIFYVNNKQKEEIKSNIKRRLKGEKFISKFIFKLKNKSETELWVKVLGGTISYNNEWVAVVVLTDITNEMLEEQKILKEKENYKLLSEFDDLAGIYNRRSYESKFHEAFNTAMRYGRPLSLIMFDIDKFKDINDNLGHQAGDIIIKEISAAVKENLRTADYFARIGGEEFMIISPETNLNKAKELAERLRLKIENHNFSTGSKITCSFGVVSLDKNDTEESLEYRVDLALYKAKENGRNRVEVEDA